MNSSQMKLDENYITHEQKLKEHENKLTEIDKTP